MGTTEKHEQSSFQAAIEKRAIYMQTKNWSLNLSCLGILLSSFLSTKVLPPSIVSEVYTQNTLWEEGNGWCCVLQRSKEKLCEKAANIGHRKRLTGRKNYASEEQQGRHEKEEKHVCAGKRRSSKVCPFIVNKALKTWMACWIIFKSNKYISHMNMNFGKVSAMSFS